MRRAGVGRREGGQTTTTAHSCACSQTTGLPLRLLRARACPRTTGLQEREIMRTPACPQRQGCPQTARATTLRTHERGHASEYHVIKFLEGHAASCRVGLPNERESRHKDVWEMLGGTETVMDHPHQSRNPCLILWRHFSREDDGPTLPGVIHAIIARAPPRARLGRLAWCENGRPHASWILWRNCSQGDKIWTCSPCVAATIRDTRSDMQAA